MAASTGPAWTATRAQSARAVAADMEALGLFEGREDRVIPLKYSDRSKSPIEPYLSDQWFVKMGDRDDGKPGLAQMTMDAVTSGKVKFFPEQLRQDLPRLARRKARLVHQPATVVGAPDPGMEPGGRAKRKPTSSKTLSQSGTKRAFAEATCRLA